MKKTPRTPSSDPAGSSHARHLALALRARDGDRAALAQLYRSVEPIFERLETEQLTRYHPAQLPDTWDRSEDSEFVQLLLDHWDGSPRDPLGKAQPDWPEFAGEESRDTLRMAFAQAGNPIATREIEADAAQTIAMLLRCLGETPNRVRVEAVRAVVLRGVIANFDPCTDFFRSYLLVSLKREVNREVWRKRLGNLPPKYRAFGQRLWKAREKLLRESPGVEPSDAALAAEMGVTIEEIERYRHEVAVASAEPVDETKHAVPAEPESAPERIEWWAKVTRYQRKIREVFPGLLLEYRRLLLASSIGLEGGHLARAFGYGGKERVAKVELDLARAIAELQCAVMVPADPDSASAFEKAFTREKGMLAAALSSQTREALGWFGNNISDATLSENAFLLHLAGESHIETAKRLGIAQRAARKRSSRGLLDLVWKFKSGGRDLALPCKAMMIWVAGYLSAEWQKARDARKDEGIDVSATTVEDIRQWVIEHTAQFRTDADDGESEANPSAR